MMKNFSSILLAGKNFWAESKREWKLKVLPNSCVMLLQLPSGGRHQLFETCNNFEKTMCEMLGKEERHLESPWFRASIEQKQRTSSSDSKKEMECNVFESQKARSGEKRTVLVVQKKNISFVFIKSGNQYYMTMESVCVALFLKFICCSYLKLLKICSMECRRCWWSVWFPIYQPGVIFRNGEGAAKDWKPLWKLIKAVL